MSELYVPAHGRRVIMPGDQPDWPADGMPVNRADPHHRRLMADGDIILKPAAQKPAKPLKPAVASDASADEQGA
jgi:hypothetical protein